MNEKNMRKIRNRGSKEMRKVLKSIRKSLSCVLAVTILSTCLQGFTPSTRVEAKEEATQSATQAATQATTQSATQSATQATTQPATQATTQSATQATTQSATLATTQSATQSTTQETTQAETKTVTQIATKDMTPTSQPTSGNQKNEANTTIPQSSVEEVTETSYILEELEDKRELYTKHFLMSDKSIVAATYDEPVHTLMNGKYVDIDNSLFSKTEISSINQSGSSVNSKLNNSLIGKAGNSLSSKINVKSEEILENKTNSLKTKFAKVSSKNKLATIEYNGYKINWFIPNANKVNSETIDGSNDKSKSEKEIDEKLILKNCHIGFLMMKA